MLREASEFLNVSFFEYMSKMKERGKLKNNKMK